MEEVRNTLIFGFYFDNFSFRIQLDPEKGLNPLPVNLEGDLILHLKLNKQYGHKNVRKY